jgi:hypothetical protein
MSSDVLLIGGPCHWKTVHIPEGQYELLVAIPQTPTYRLDPNDPTPMDLQVARYVRDRPIEMAIPMVGVQVPQRFGWFFTYAGTR